MTSTQPIARAWVRLSRARSMNVAGRKMVGSISTSVRPGSQRLQRLLRRWRVTSSVLPSGCFSTISSRPGPSLMTASPMGGGEPIDDLGHVAQPERRAAAEGDDGAGQVGRLAGSATGGGRPAAGWACRRSRRCPATAASPAALTTASSVTPLARSRSGSTSTWNCLSRWPQMATLATPGTDISLGRIVHSARIGQVAAATASSTRRRSSARGWSTRAAAG